MKGPIPGEKQIPYQEVKPTKPDPKRINPGTQIPDHAEKFKWKIKGRDLDGGKTETSIPVYSFSVGRCDFGIAGHVPPGQYMELTEVKVCGRNYYKYDFKGTPGKSKQKNPSGEYWIDGLNIVAE